MKFSDASYENRAAEIVVQIHLSTDSGVPIYLKIVNQVKYLAAAGRLAPGDDLPAIRTLAEQLLVNPNTVARAYRELEIAGLVEKRRTAGTFVSESGSPLARRERIKILTERVHDFVLEAGPDSFLSAKARGVGLARELGIEGLLVGPAPRRQRASVLSRGNLQPLPEGLQRRRQV